MKKTFNINLAGYPFVIDEDAYNLLKDYLDTIRYAFDTNDDTEDLATDIESRIAEILLENFNGVQRIVTLQEISGVIERIGKPSDFIEVEDSVSNSDADRSEEIKIEEETITPPPYEPNKKSRNPFVRKNLFRDPQNAMLGGVCSGLANYIGIDVTIVRLLTVLLFFLSASTVAIVYIVLWIVVPEARTPLQRMKMMGEDPTVENIGRTVTENFQDGELKSDSDFQKEKPGFLSSLFSIFVKCLVILGLIIACPVLLALTLGLVGCIIAVFVLGVIIVGGTSNTFWMFNSASEEILAFYILLAVIGGIITIGVPLWLLLRMYWKKDRNYSQQSRRALLIVWLCGIALLTIFTVKAVRVGKLLTNERVNRNVEQIENLDIDAEDLENIEISSSGITLTDKNGKTVIISPEGINIDISENSDKPEIIESETTVETVDSISPVHKGLAKETLPNDSI